MAQHVDVDTFTRAESDRMFADLQRDAGGINRFRHNREPASVDEQTVVRMNRDTLYSFAVVDLAAGATLTLPDAGERYLSAMILDNDHFVSDVLHDAGEHQLDADRVGSRYALVAVRTLVDPDDAADAAAVAAVQDAVTLTAASAEPFVPPEWDPASLDATRDALLALAAGLRGFDRMFGSREQVDPVRHLIGTAAGWGGLPTTEAAYVGVSPSAAPGRYALTMRDVPVDAFWSVSVYDAKGFFVPNPQGRYSVNSVTAVRDGDGAVTVRFAPADDFGDEPNTIPVPEGWNFLVRLYRPRPEVLDGAWIVPELRAG
ncbi:DUF1214 domain-containing protein [Promicromonospora kroppenstedtii]|uniref:DUF1214 domain-containing protein n=1 Tax=Promicromonospora kroppenstedtii TaxID=440482 RepID=UPI0004BC3AD9|nr:DUF1214 domain-containing protein [Promicromonospora kroppenstedtii]